MQIGSPGSAYGPGGIMSRPTLGRAITPLPSGPQGVTAALQQARRMPLRINGAPGLGRVVTSSALAGLLRGVGSHANVRHGVIQNELARRLAAGAHQRFQEPLAGDGGTGGSPALAGLAEGVPAPQQDFLPQASIATADPQVLLARARLAQMMGGS